MQKAGLYLAIVAMLSATFAIGMWARLRPAEVLQKSLADIPAQLGDWQLTREGVLPTSVKDRLRASSYLSRTYSNGRTELDLFVAYYSSQRAGESMHSPKHCLPGAGWDISQHRTIAIPIGRESFTVNQYGIQKGPVHALTLYWYQSKDRVVANEYRAKVLFAYDGIVNSRTAGSIVRITGADKPETAADASRFARLIIREVQRCLGAPTPAE